MVGLVKQPALDRLVAAIAVIVLAALGALVVSIQRPGPAPQASPTAHPSAPPAQL